MGVCAVGENFEVECLFVGGGAVFIYNIKLKFVLSMYIKS